ncbi:hypothetical protein BH10PSE17_BH10PSE17_31730 [soil metagenome]
MTSLRWFVRRISPVFAALTCSAVLMFVGLKPAHADAVDDAVAGLQHDWEVSRYQSPVSERERRFESLASKAHALVEANPQRPELMIWEGIALSSWAGEKGGLGALGLVKRAKALYESAIQIDGTVLDGSAYNSLGVLYYKVPGWPLGFGDKDKARAMLQKALQLNPQGIDPNFFYADYLIETQHPDDAVPYLDKALQAPPRPNRSIADTGRREEVRALLEKIKKSGA